MLVECKNCRKLITGRGKSGLCHSCATIEAYKDPIHKRNVSIGQLTHWAGRSDLERKSFAKEKLNSPKAMEKKRLTREIKKREDPEYGKKISANLQKPEIHKKQGQTLRLRIQNDDEFAKKFFKQMSRKSKPERFLESFILLCHLPLRYTGNGEFVVRGICADFAQENNKQVVELSANRNTHTIEKFENYKKIRMRQWNERGIDSLILHGSDLDDLMTLCSKLEKFLHLKIEISCSECFMRKK